jgi:hypothetical protein
VITTEGKRYIKRYLAGFVPNIAESIAMGIGNQAESVSDDRLQFEFSRATINLTSYDFINDKLIFKAPTDTELSGTVFEVGIFSKEQNAAAGAYSSRLLAAFESETEDWFDSVTLTDATFGTANFRVGSDSLIHSNAASTTQTSVWSEIEIDLSGNSASDVFSFAYSVGNANTSALSFQFLTDTSNYYTFSLGAQSAGYKTITRTKGSATVTGSPTWSDITEIRVVTTSGAGGASAVTFDGIRIEDTDTINPDYVLIARKVLATPFILEPGKIQSVEYALDITI